MILVLLDQGAGAEEEINILVQRRNVREEKISILKN
jgi:hypothetical protein